ncbi:DUF4238 domain-containing protein [Rhizobium laguerreae]|uniref:DUF4238 domain-containing protein n=1 Tax=Rhizobium laguerreae TaxID=1076926 RepID=UPI001C90A0D5|nr:DUF4238 domain-containing protein [Rhizobium laguerreae]MBY3038633.1 DUF4238 domain-containing protein [Rhizobium laguerreae]
MSNVKYQHYLARHHMSWFANDDGTNSFWSVNDGRLLDNVKLTEIGGQTYLYESEELPRNFVEKQILESVETGFFAARNRAINDRAVRRSEDRQAIRRYVVAQFLRQGYLHKRLVHLEQDLLFIAKEMGVERLWRTETVLAEGRRKRASSTMAKGLVDLDETVKLLKHHVVIFVERPENDLLLPDRGFVQVYEEKGKLRTDGLKSPNLKILMPIAPDCALKLFRPNLKSGFPDRARMNDEAHVVFMHNLGLNANNFIAGTQQALSEANLNALPYFDPTAERLSMVMQIYRAGALDDMVGSFCATQVPHIPEEFVRKWFYREKFIPAVNKLFNPDGGPDAETFLFEP